MVSHGCSILGRSALITITYKAGVERLRSAGCVARDWKALFRLLKQRHPEVAKMALVRVKELTKKGTPHFHLVIGPIPEGMRSNCWGSRFNLRRYRERLPACECLAHVFGRAWSRVNAGESYIVHGVEVGSARGAGAYLAKYMMKEMEGERLQELGMSRRWSRTRSWPSEPRIRFEQSLRSEGWHRRIFSPGHTNLEEIKHGFGEEADRRRMTPVQEENLAVAARARFIKLGKEYVCPQD